MLSEDGGDSTHIIPSHCHGAEIPTPRDEFLSFTWNTKDNFPDVKKAVKERYGDLLNLTPTDLFQKCQPQRLPCGAIEIFRSDNLHAGPLANMEREVLFVEIRVKDERGPADENYQFKLADLKKLADPKKLAGTKRKYK